MKMKDFLRNAAKQSGIELKIEGLVKKTGRFNFKTAKSHEDILGFDYVTFWKGDYFKFYSANPPYVGMTPPEKVLPMLGFESFENYKIDYKEAINIFKSGDWGNNFSLIELYQPFVFPQVKEPFWYFLSDKGFQVMIGANTGKVQHFELEEMMAF